MKMHLPPLGPLRTFEAAARLLSFQRAAAELGVTQSAVSHQIAALEDFLKVKLFERLPRRVALTEAGILYAPYARAGFERIMTGTSLLTRISNTDDLIIEAYPTFVVRWLIPRLTALRKARPDLKIRFGTSQLDWELNIDSADVGIIYTDRTDRPQLHYRRLVQARLVPICSRPLAEKMGSPASPRILRRCTRLVLYTAPDDWRTWLEAAGVQDGDDPPIVKFDSYLTAIEAAIDGHGIAIAPEFLVAADLRSGRLVRPFDLAVPQAGGWYLIYREERRDDPRIVWFEKWISDQFASRK
ncbi:MAG TPA: LysR substrate-binding domain-containing protein [Steroidobacteraceae bacterium]|nr:LysR substrate-binding domain-containing protein [Steroidobacteraceae bacterium]